MGVLYKSGLSIMTQETLIYALEQIVEHHWNTNKQPVLLSNLPPLLMKSLPDYKDILSGRSLKKFIKETEGKYKLVEHPYQKAKVALIPKNESYKFPELDEKQEQSVIINRNAEKALIEFLKALKKLPEQDQEKVQIPVSVLVKMLK